MGRLVKFQIGNMFKQKFYYLCLGWLIFMGPVIDFLHTVCTNKYETMQVLPQIVTCLSRAIWIFDEIIFVTLFCCLDFSNKTTKNIIGRGYSRTQLLISKYIGSLVGIFSFIIILFVVIFGLFGINGLGYDSKTLYMLIIYIMKSIACTIFYSTMATVLEKKSLSLIANLFVPSIFREALWFVCSKFNIDVRQCLMFNISFKFMNNLDLANMIYAIMICSVHIIVFIVLGISIIQRKEIK